MGGISGTIPMVVFIIHVLSLLKQNKRAKYIPIPITSCSMTLIYTYFSNLTIGRDNVVILNIKD